MTERPEGGPFAALLREGFAPDAVARAAASLEDERRRRAFPDGRPRQVVAFTGHMVDRPGRPRPRFPPARAPEAAAAIADALDAGGVGPGDLGLCGGAAGGDLLFAEACLARGAALELRIPRHLEAFLEESVNPAGEAWRRHFFSAAQHPSARLLVAPAIIGEADHVHARRNLWELHAALAWGATRRTALLALWDGRPGDGPGGTADMVDRARRAGLDVRILDAGIHRDA